MYDVVIAGAGPAGCACALALSRGGHRVALLDARTFPRDKVCGDAIPGAAVRSLRRLADELGIPAPEPAGAVAVRHARFYGDGARPIELAWRLPAYNSTRLAFDAWLSESVRAYTTTHLRLGKRVGGVTVHSDRVVVEASGAALEAKLIVGCDGANSIVARALTGTRLDRRHHLAAVRAYFRGVRGAAPATNDVYFLRDWQPGYAWVFPVGDDRYNVGVGMSSAAVSERRVDLRAVLDTVTRSAPALAGRFAEAERCGPTVGFGLPVGSRTVPASGERFLLCGDAASLIDPLGGHGIDTAIASGILAAEQADWCLRHERFDAGAMRPYEAALERRIRPTLRRNGYVVRAGTRAPWLLDVAGALDRLPGGQAVKGLVQGWL